MSAREFELRITTGILIGFAIGALLYLAMHVHVAWGQATAEYICWTGDDGANHCMTPTQMQAAGMSSPGPDGTVCYSLPTGAKVCRSK